MMKYCSKKLEKNILKSQITAAKTHPFICQRRFSNGKVGNRKNYKPTFIISVFKVEY